MVRYEQYKKILIYIEKNLTGKFYYGEMEKKLNYSIRHIRRLFSYYNVKPINRYISERKMANILYSVQMLNESIHDAIHKYGFQSYDSFSRAFKSFYGKTPAKHNHEFKVVIRKIVGELTVPVISTDFYLNEELESLSLKDVYWGSDDILVTSFLLNFNNESKSLVESLLEMESGADYLQTINLNNQSFDETSIKTLIHKIITNPSCEQANKHILFIPYIKEHKDTIGLFMKVIRDNGDIAIQFDDKVVVSNNAYERLFYSLIKYLNSTKSLGINHDVIADYMRNGYNLITYNEGSASELPTLLLPTLKHISLREDYENKTHILLVQTRTNSELDSIMDALQLDRKTNNSKLELGFIIDEKQDKDVKIILIQI